MGDRPTWWREEYRSDPLLEALADVDASVDFAFWALLFTAQSSAEWRALERHGLDRYYQLDISEFRLSRDPH